MPLTPTGAVLYFMAPAKVVTSASVHDVAVKLAVS